MNNRKHYIVIENPEHNCWRPYIIIPEGAEYDPNKYYSGFDTEEEAQKWADKYNTTYYVSDYDDDEIKAFYESIDFTELEKEVVKNLGVRLTFTHSLDHNRDGWCVRFRSNEDLCTLSGLLGKMLKSCHIEQFNTSIYAEGKTGELRLWMTLDFSYEHHGGGGNGCNLCNVNYSEKDGWNIRFENAKK